MNVVCFSPSVVNSYLIEKDKRRSLTQPTDGSATSHASGLHGIPQDSCRISAISIHNRHPGTLTNEITGPSVSMNLSASLSWVLFGIDDILRNARLLLHTSSKQTSLDLPSEFWNNDDGVALSETLCQQFEQDLQW